MTYDELIEVMRDIEARLIELNPMNYSNSDVYDQNQSVIDSILLARKALADIRHSTIPRPGSLEYEIEQAKRAQPYKGYQP